MPSKRAVKVQPKQATPRSNPAGAEKLKEQGNTLFAQRKWSGAFAKYSEAIEQDPMNAVYWANRAACSLELKDYLEAHSDALAATRIDPSYAKAWGRLGAAERGVSNFEGSIKAYKQALDLLPPEDKMTPTDRKCQQQFQTALRTVEQDTKTRSGDNSRTIVITADDEESLHSQFPWHRAKNANEDWGRSGDNISSAWLIMDAYEEFQEGIDRMKLLKKAEVPANGLVRDHPGARFRISNGSPTAMSFLVGGLVRDSRVFHMDTNFLPLLLNQISFEMTVRNVLDGSLNVVKKGITERLQGESWDDVRKSLFTTINMWILRGYMENSLGKHASGFEHYGKALELIDWGREKWSSAPPCPPEDLLLFDHDVVRGVRMLRLLAIMDACAHDVTDKYTFEDVIKLAQEIVDDVDGNPPSWPVEEDPGSYLAYWVNPKGEALSAMGLAYTRLGHASRDISSKKHKFGLAAKYYTQSAFVLPEDDERRVYFGTCALQALWSSDAPLKETLPLVEKLKPSIPKMRKIWANSAMSRRRDSSISLMEEFEKQVRKALKSGRMTMDGVAKPQVRR